MTTRVCIVVAALSVAAPAAAHEGLSPPPSASLPPAPPGDGATAERIVADAEAAAKTPERAAIVADAVRNAKKALERAHGARTSGDTAHARLLDGLALEWAETARDLLRAADVESRASKVAREAHETATKADRARALLEETQARLGRARAEVDRAEQDAKQTQKGASDAEAARLEKGMVPNPKKKPEDKPKAPPPKKKAP